MRTAEALWGAGSGDRFPLDRERANRRLTRMIFPERTGEELQIPESPLEMMNKFAVLFRKEWDRIQKEAEQGSVSRIGSKADEWKQYAEQWQNVTLIIEQGKKTNEELLMGLSLKETRDYCKYLQIAAGVSFAKADGRCVITVSFASDLPEILKPLKNVRPVFLWVKRYSDKLRNVILTYGMIEMDAL